MRRFIVICVVSVLLGPAYAASGAAVESGRPDHVVHAGAVDPTDPGSLHMYEAYFPRHLKVHKGDRVRWEFPNQGDIAQAFHTVTFGTPEEIPYVRADEIPGTFAFGERTLFTSGCGRPGQPVCVVSSTDQFVSSGTPIQHSAGPGEIEPFDVVIDLPEGTYSYFCTLHHPLMQGTVEVVADEVAVDNPSPDDFTDEIAALTLEANETFESLAEPTLTFEGGRRVWIVPAGARTVTEVPVVTEAFLPSSLKIFPGDTVRWVMGGTAHTVTFPGTGALRAPTHLMVACEFDDPATGAPGVPLIALVGCPPGGTLEVMLTEIGANQQRAPGDAVVSPATLHNSGIMIDPTLPERMRGRPPGSGDMFPWQFEASFPVPGTFAYSCEFHKGFMGGTITVEAG